MKKILAKISKYEAIPVLLILIVLFIVFTIFSKQFLALKTLSVMASILPIAGLMTVSTALLIISGEFDLSIASIYMASGAIFAYTFTQLGLNIVVSALISLVFGFIIGFLNAIIVTKLRVSSFIETLGMMFICYGISLIITKGYTMSFSPQGNSLIFINIIAGKIHGIPTGFLWLLGITIIFHFILNNTVLGNHIYASGSNSTASLMMGIDVNKVKGICFILNGIIASFAGIMATCRIGAAVPGTGTDMLLRVIAGTFIGGTLFGGTGSVMGALFGAAIIQVIDMGLIMVGIVGYYFYLILGIVIIIVITLYSYTRRK